MQKTLQIIIVTIFVAGCLFALAEATDLGLIGIFAWVVVLIGCVAVVGSLAPEDAKEPEKEKIND